MLKQEQIDEWAEGEVTTYLVALLKAKLDHTYHLRASVFFPGEPNRTQEGKAQLLGMEAELADLIQALEEKDLSQLEVGEPDEERIRNTPIPRPGGH